MSTLEIRDLKVAVEDKEILRGVNLTVQSGKTHAIMGPNGSGKSTLAYAIAGHPKYTITSGEVLLDGVNLLELTVDERARAGLFLAMQYPVEVPGVSVSNFLRTAVTAVRGEAPKLRQFAKDLKSGMDALRVVSEGINRVRAGGEVGIMLITHYTRILRHITPDFVHVFAGGKIVESGGKELADQLEEHGYVRFTGKQEPAAIG